MSTHNLTIGQVESLMRLMAAAVDVKRRYQFYLWALGDLQRLVPHKLSVCGTFDMGLRDLAFEVLNSIPLPPELVQALSDVRSPLMHHLIKEWGQQHGQSVWIKLGTLNDQDKVAQGLVQHGYEWLLVHGVSRPGRPHDLESFFVFGEPHGQADEATAQALNLFLPYLHSTYVRVSTTEREMGAPKRVVHSAGHGVAPPARAVSNLTEREREILRWVRDGKSNLAIADELGISALTVKNHIQKILRKLGAANRAQAVAKALMMNALSTPLALTGPVLQAQGIGDEPSSPIGS